MNAGNLKVVEAKTPLRLFPTKSEIRRGRKADTSNCAIALAAKRTCKSGFVQILRSTAYVELPDEKGNKRIERFVLTGAAREAIIDFDLEGKIPEAGFVLKPPTKATTRKAKAATQKKYHKSPNKGTQPKVKYSTDKLLTQGGVRRGRGVIV